GHHHRPRASGHTGVTLMAYENEGLGELVAQIKQASANIADGDARTNKRLDQIKQSVNALYLKHGLSNAGWQCEVRREKDQGVHFTIHRGSLHGERPYMSPQPQKPKDTIVIYVATKGAGSELGSFALNQITQDFVQSEAAKFFERLTVEHSTPSAQ